MSLCGRSWAADGRDVSTGTLVPGPSPTHGSGPSSSCRRETAGCDRQRIAATRPSSDTAATDRGAPQRPSSTGSLAGPSALGREIALGPSSGAERLPASCVRTQSACLRRNAGISISSILLLASASTFAAACECALRRVRRVGVVTADGVRRRHRHLRALDQLERAPAGRDQHRHTARWACMRRSGRCLPAAGRPPPCRRPWTRGPGHRPWPCPSRPSRACPSPPAASRSRRR